MFITFEGIDGSGKSTQARMLIDRLERSGRKTLLLREPGGTDLSERIRDLLLDPDRSIEPFAELLLFSAARAQLVAECIRPALAAGITVVSDRFFDSTTAYQGGGRGVAEPEWLQDFHRHVTGGLAPDRTVLCRLPAGVALSRRSHRGQDRMEREGAAFQESVARAYDRLAASEPDRFLVLDATCSQEEIHEEIWADIAPRLESGTGRDASGSEPY